MTSDLFRSFLTYLPTLIRYCQMWLDITAYLPTPRSDIRFLRFYGLQKKGRKNYKPDLVFRKIWLDPILSAINILLFSEKPEL